MRDCIVRALSTLLLSLCSPPLPPTLSLFPSPPSFLIPRLSLSLSLSLSLVCVCVFRSNRYPFPPSSHCIRKHLVAVDLERANPPAAKQPIISFHRYTRAARYTVKRGNVLEVGDATTAPGENCSARFPRFRLVIRHSFYVGDEHDFTNRAFTGRARSKRLFLFHSLSRSKKRVCT